VAHPNQPFDPRLGLLRRGRAARGAGDAFYLHRRAAEELLERLDLVARPFATALDVSAHPALAEGLRARGLAVVEAGEADLPAIGGPFDLVTSLGLLDTINDLPGALALIRRALRPDGLFLAAFAGAGSLPRLRRAMRAGEEAEGLDPSPRIHPQIDVRAAGDLLVRAGFALPVVDRDVIEVRYPSLTELVADLRAMGATNSLARRSRRPVTRTGLAAATADFGAGTAERFEIVFLSGWAPAPDQPVPARRGSATASLADALKPR
jgi:NADH dehydrogenase [ubiquinone] 1 alpha subcomplex assembly factor 5